MNDDDWTAERLMKAIKPDHGYNARSKLYLDFIRYLTELDPKQRKIFVGWMTGCRRLPMGGLMALDPPITINKKHYQTEGWKADNVFPSVSTCHHYIKMPEYSSYEILVEKFKEAVLER